MGLRGKEGLPVNARREASLGVRTLEVGNRKQVRWGAAGGWVEYLGSIPPSKGKL